MAELYGKANGICHGKGGTMHIADVSVGYLGANGVLAAGCVMAPGVALSIKHRRSGQVALTFFGDGAANRGPFHEGVNMAALWRLPVIFFCENNRWASTTPRGVRAGGSCRPRRRLRHPRPVGGWQRRACRARHRDPGGRSRPPR
jgi:TPP-dependent pyruvate/acetoin dehydrogenase alpha subunit